MNEAQTHTTLILKPAFVISAQPGTGQMAVVVRAERPLQTPVAPKLN